jgi:protein-disulfide isomerase
MAKIARMRFSAALCASLTAAVGAAACQQSDPTVQYKLDQINQKLEAIDHKLGAPGAVGAGAVAQRPAAPAPPPRPQADPAAVYSVPIGDAPVKGPATAKVTIVEAADFA